MMTLGLVGLRRSMIALLVTAAAWAAGCATPQPRVEPFFTGRSYTPNRIALLPPAVFAVYDEVGENDPQKSAALAQKAAEQAAVVMADALRRRGYDVDLSARWDGVKAPDGTMLVTGNDLAWFANAVLEFANSPEGAREGAAPGPAFVAPQLAQRLGWATQSDALLYVNLKGVSVSQGKKTAEVVGTVLFVVVIAAVILWMISQSKSGGKSSGPSSPTAGGWGQGGRAAPRATSAGSGFSSARPLPAGAGAPTVATAVPRGRGYAPSGGGGRVYGPQVNVGLGVGMVVPIEGPTHTHHGTVQEDDEYYAGDDLYASMTLVSAYDGRVLWHMRQNLDVDLADPQDVDRFVRGWMDTVPASLRAAPTQGTAAPATTAAPTPAAVAPAAAP